MLVLSGGENISTIS